MTQEIAPDAPGAPAGAAPDAPAQAALPPAEPSVRRRRAPRPDPLLVDSAAIARAALAEIAEPAQIGAGHQVRVEEDRLVTHLFESALPGYRGWNWFASLARAPRSRTVTVCEVGLLPGDDALLAPEWVPWSDRVSAEEKARAEDAEQEAPGEGDGAADVAGEGAAAADVAGEDAAAAQEAVVDSADRDAERPRDGEPS